MRRDVAGEDLAVVGERGIAREDEHVARAADLVERVLLADAALRGDEVGNLVAAAADDFGGAVEDLVAFVPRERRLVGTRRCERAADLIDGGLGDGADQPAGVGVMHLEGSVAADALAGDPHLLAQHMAVTHVLQFGHHVHSAALLMPGD